MFHTHTKQALKLWFCVFHFKVLRLETRRQKLWTEERN